MNPRLKACLCCALLFIFICNGNGQNMKTVPQISITINQIISNPQNPTEVKEILSLAFDTVLQEFQLKGSIMFYDPATRTYYSNDFKWAEAKHLPASTFKIPNSIIALETGVIEHDSTVLKWNGEPRRLKIWEQDLSFKDAFRLSCVPCYQEIARKIGYERMSSHLKAFDYPGMVFTETTVDNFWLEGESKISQTQQIDFLNRFYFSQLPISEKTYSLMREIMLVEKTAHYALSGKTGWGIRDGNNNGWYVGFIETKGKVVFFATNVIPAKGFNLDNFTSARIEVTKAAMKKMGLMVD